ncbi:MAG TPA: hypothetical protein VGS20_01310 [Candidatus Acidoferrales bacterium]|nr:hypothetical protein [Candidatus Acidoferrales bacterium]
MRGKIRPKIPAAESRARQPHGQVRFYDDADFPAVVRLYLLTFPFLRWEDAVEWLPSRPGPAWVAEKNGRVVMALVTDADGALTTIADPASATRPETSSDFQALVRSAAAYHLPAGGYLRVVFPRALAGMSDALKSAGSLSVEFLRLHVLRFSEGGEAFAPN